MTQSLSRRALLAGLGVSVLPLGRMTAHAQQHTAILDTHVHLLRSLHHSQSLESAAQVALRVMDAFGIERAIVSPPPFNAGHPQGPNPGTLHANIARLERLLDHNPHARIVWVHAGWDLTGERTVPLMRDLLERHANLAMSVKYDHAGAKATAPFPPDGDAVRPGWIAMLRGFPGRFVVGSDQFIDQGTERLEGARQFVDALPPDLARLVGSENAKRIYRLSAM